MTEQSAQGSSDPTKAALTPTIHKPDSRADVDRKKSATIPQRKRKYPDGKKTRKKNAQDILEFDVEVVSARYDDEKQSWMYTLKDLKQNAMLGETEETRLG